MKINKKGFTLIELLVVVAIIAVIFIVVVDFFFIRIKSINKWFN